MQSPLCYLLVEYILGIKTEFIYEDVCLLILWKPPTIQLHINTVVEYRYIHTPLSSTEQSLKDHTRKAQHVVSLHPGGTHNPVLKLIKPICMCILLKNLGI